MSDFADGSRGALLIGLRHERAVDLSDGVRERLVAAFLVRACQPDVGVRGVLADAHRREVEPRVELVCALASLQVEIAEVDGRPIRLLVRIDARSCAGRCRQAERAGVGGPEVGALALMLQRCPAFGPIGGER